MQDLAVISDSISEATGRECILSNPSSISGGCINEAFRLTDQNDHVYFIKKNSREFLPFFKAEAEALSQINRTNTVRVPEIICYGESEISSFLILEFIKEGSSGKNGQRKLGEQLAQLHLIKMPHFGWTTDNCIGATPQPNPKSNDWISFYRDYRLLHQFNLARKKGYSFEGEKKLLENIGFFFKDYTPHPSLLHGDLWGGNSGYTADGDPFIFDPASYFGDRETDIAFTYMFGGYDSSFYDSYEKTFPLNPGFTVRKTLYNLYHELNHLNLFGRGYESSSQSSIQKLVSQIH